MEGIDTVQDFLIMLGIKPRLHILKISIFTLNHAIVRPTKIIKDLLKDRKILIFIVIFQSRKLAESFWFFFYEEYWTGRPATIDFFLNALFSKNVPNFYWLP